MRRIATTLLALTLATAPAYGVETTWDGIKETLYPHRALQDGTGVIAIDAPYRTPDDARTDIKADIIAPEGLNIGSVTLVLDENPMPVSAIFRLDTPQPRFFFDVTMRVDGPTPLHVVVETTDSRLWVAETFVKTSGLGACSAPPGTDPKEALATLGQMKIEMVGGLPMVAGLRGLTNRFTQLDVDISHPSHSGLQMDQISLLFIPMRYVDSVTVDLDGKGYVDLEGSISLSENPRVGISVPNSTQSVDVTVTDTDGTVSRSKKQLSGF